MRAFEGNELLEIRRCRRHRQLAPLGETHIGLPEFPRDERRREAVNRDVVDDEKNDG
jgi:hypothetical protein